MWKSVFLAAGIFACVAGAELLLIDSAVVLPMDGRGDTGGAKAAVGSLTPEPRFR